MDLKNITLSEISQRKTNMHDITYMWNLKCNTNKQTHIYRKQTCGCQRGDLREKGQIRGMGLTDTDYYI